MNYIIEEFNQRKADTIAAKVLRHGRQRAEDVAKRLSRRGHIQARCELANEATSKLIDLCYQRDTDGVACNVDRRTGRLLVPAPWGRLGHAHYGLRRSEAVILRAYMFTLEDGGQPPLFSYDRLDRGWYLNNLDYRAYDQAVAYWRKHQIDVAAWRKLAS